jgi:hypothetical protein
MTKSALGKTVFNSGQMFSKLSQLGETNPQPGERFPAPWFGNPTSGAARPTLLAEKQSR